MICELYFSFSSPSAFLRNFRCGESQRFFYMEVGRHSAIGAGELYLETDDPLIAQNMHTTIMKWVKRRLDATAQNKQNPTAVPPFDFIIDFFFADNVWFLYCSAMSTVRSRDELGPITRNRSSSANEASKPSSILQRRQTHVGNKPLNFSPSGGKCTDQLPDLIECCCWLSFIYKYFLFLQKKKKKYIHKSISFLESVVYLYFIIWFPFVYYFFFFSFKIYFFCCHYFLHSYSPKWITKWKKTKLARCRDCVFSRSTTKLYYELNETNETFINCWGGIDFCCKMAFACILPKRVTTSWPLDTQKKKNCNKLLSFTESSTNKMLHTCGSVIWTNSFVSVT